MDWKLQWVFVRKLRPSPLLEVISRPVAARVDRGAAWTLDQAPKLPALSVSGGQ